MPRRGVIASLLTAAGLVLLLTFKTPTEMGLPARGNGAVSRALAPATTPTPTTGAPQAALGNQGGDEGGGDDGGGAVTPTTPSPTPTPAPTSGASGPTRTITGPVVTTRYGDVQLQVTLTKGRISDITPLQLPSDLQRSAYISSVAGPILRDEALQAQSAQIDLLSGATYTSEAYAQSLQAVLDRARS